MNTINTIKNQNKKYALYFIYLYSSFLFSVIYFPNISHNMKIVTTIINWTLAITMTLSALYYIKKDFNTDKYIKNSSGFGLFIIFFCYCIIANIVNGNGFKTFNNIYFIIHSVIFFLLIIQDNYCKENYLKIINFIILLITSTLAVISFLTILIYLSNLTGLTNKLSSPRLQYLFHRYAPLHKRWYTLLQNANTFAHLVSMSFFLNIIPYKTIKRRKYKNLIILIQLLNTTVLIFTASRGAFLAVISGFLLIIVYQIVKLNRKNKKKLLIVFLSFISALLILIIIDKIFFNNKDLKILFASLLRFDNLENGSGRFDTWSKLLKLPFLTNPFGFNDDYLYHYMLDLNAFYPKEFINNSGRAHNMYMQVLVGYGIIAFILFIACIIKTLKNTIHNYSHIMNENKIYYLVFFTQFITILAGGIFEQLPIFNLSTHSLIFMFVWANLITLTTTKKIKE